MCKTITVQRSAFRAVCFCQGTASDNSFASGDSVRERNDYIPKVQPDLFQLSINLHKLTAQAFVHVFGLYSMWPTSCSCRSYYNLLPVCTAVPPSPASVAVASGAQARRACSASKFGGPHATQNVHWHLFHKFWSRVYGTVRRARHNNPSFARSALQALTRR